VRLGESEELVLGDFWDSLPPSPNEAIHELAGHIAIVCTKD
jgi:hypothetical protein